MRRYGLERECVVSVKPRRSRIAARRRTQKNPKFMSATNDADHLGLNWTIFKTHIKSTSQTKPKANSHLYHAWNSLTQQTDIKQRKKNHAQVKEERVRYTDHLPSRHVATKPSHPPEWRGQSKKTNTSTL